LQLYIYLYIYSFSNNESWQSGVARSNNFALHWNENDTKTAFNFLDRDLAALAEDLWREAAAEIVVHVRIPVTDGINILS